MDRMSYIYITRIVIGLVYSVKYLTVQLRSACKHFKHMYNNYMCVLSFYNNSAVPVNTLSIIYSLQLMIMSACKE